MAWKSDQLHINVKAHHPPYLSSNGPCENDSLACHERVGHVGMEALVPRLQLTFIQSAVAVIEQDVVDQVLVAFLDQRLNLQPDHSTKSAGFQD